MCPGDYLESLYHGSGSGDINNRVESDLDKQVNKYVIVIFAYRIVQ